MEAFPEPNITWTYRKCPNYPSCENGTVHYLTVRNVFIPSLPRTNRNGMYLDFTPFSLYWLLECNIMRMKYFPQTRARDFKSCQANHVTLIIRVGSVIERRLKCAETRPISCDRFIESRDIHIGLQGKCNRDSPAIYGNGNTGNVRRAYLQRVQHCRLRKCHRGRVCFR